MPDLSDRLDPTADAHCVDPQKALLGVTMIGYRAETIMALLVQHRVPLSALTVAALGLVHDSLSDQISEEAADE